MELILTILGQMTKYRKPIENMLNGYVENNIPYVVLRDQAHYDTLASNIEFLMTSNFETMMKDYEVLINMKKIREIIRVLVACQSFTVEENERMELLRIYKILCPNEQ